MDYIFMSVVVAFIASIFAWAFSPPIKDIRENLILKPKYVENKLPAAYRKDYV